MVKFETNGRRKRRKGTPNDEYEENFECVTATNRCTDRLFTESVELSQRVKITSAHS